MDDRERLDRLEDVLAGLLKWGAIVACGLIAAGMAAGLLGDAWPGPPDGFARRCATVGIVTLIALPALRVAVSLIMFLVDRDYVFAVVSGVVLVVMAVGLALGAVLG